MADLLQFWHPTLDEPILENWFPWGVVAPGSSADKAFRVRNSSPSYTALEVMLSLTEMGTPTLSVAAQHYLSVDGRRYTATVSIGAIGPGAMSQPVTLRRVTALTADTGPGNFQLLATAGDWS